MIKKYRTSIGLFLLFETIAVTLWLTSSHTFFLYNFTYIGFFVALGVALMTAKYKYGRIFTEWAVGGYMLVYLGIILRENMQLEGFFYFAALGIFQAAVLHYAIAKIAGPFLFGRAWCGYACWTAMLLDLLPFKTPQKPRYKKLEYVRLGVFGVSLLFVCLVLKYKKETVADIMFISFIVGNLVYYVVGILFAFLFKDNRAFCKYFCPVTIFLKPASYFALWRVKVNHEKCTSCQKCKKVCPMDVDLLDDKRSRKNGTECIQCGSCRIACPQKAIK